MSLEQLPNELVHSIADTFLNPAERARLSVCSHSLLTALPRSLRIKIQSSSKIGVLGPEFFVSPADDLNKVVDSADNLVYGREYYLWSFDYERQNRAFLGRHTRHAHEPSQSGRIQYRYTIGLRPCQPNQTWKIVGGNDGDIVMWGEDVALTVGGTNPRARQPDSDIRGFLSCAKEARDTLWYVINAKSPEIQLFTIQNCSQHDRDDDVPEKDLIVHAIPDVCDEGEYLLHSPKSSRNGSICCEGYHVIVNFHFWIDKGIMYFEAPVLPFSLGIPILETDVLSAQQSCPLANLLDIKSARWGCVIYYMAGTFSKNLISSLVFVLILQSSVRNFFDPVAADVGEGKRLDMNRFLTRVTDHRDHKVMTNEERDHVYIDVQNKIICTNVASVPKDVNEIWRFILSW